MFQVHDTVLYGTDGVCEIVEIAARTFGRKTQEYFVLQPLYGNQATIFVPTQNEKLCAKMRRILSADEIYAIIRTMADEEPLWIENEAARKEAYLQILRGGDRRAMARLIKTLYLHRQEVKNTGRKFHASDERMMKEAEKLLYGEFAHVLHLEPAQVQPFIQQKIRELNAS